MSYLPDDESERDSALVDALGVVGCPNDGVGDAGVDAQSAEKGARVTNARRCPVSGKRICKLDAVDFG